MEPRFGHDFSQVRVHTGTRAAQSAQAVNALAYTVGHNVVFGGGAPTINSAAGRKLMAHELTHVVQQQGSVANAGLPGETHGLAEYEADAVAHRVAESAHANVPLRIGRHARALSRQQAPPSTSGMTRADFEDTMRRRYGVTRIATGTMQEQATRLTPQGGAPPGGIVLPNWQSWDPGSASPVYQSIIDSFEDFHRSIGGVPRVQEILFFETNYQVNPAGMATPDPSVGASFGVGQLTIYRGLTTENKVLPIGRSNVQGNYPSVTIQVTGIPGQSPGAPLPYVSREQSITRLVSHELGHGLAEAALGPNPAQALDPTMMADYRRETGWTAGHPAHLFDIGVPAVAAALAAGTPPPANAEITPGNWNSPQWVEQPLTRYMVAGGPGEDFAEAVMTFVHEPNLLLSRSPRRFRFLNSRKDRWLPRLLQLRQIGDFPEPRNDRRVA